MSEKTKTCLYCGKEILAVAIKCRHCGKFLDKEQNTQEEIKEIRCPYCSEKIKETDTVCPYCNESLSQNNSKLVKNDTLYSVRTKNYPIFIKVIKVILILAILICLGWVLFGDYPTAIRNQENFWYGQYISAGILHTLLAILFTIMLSILK